MVSNEMSITFPALSRNEAFARSVAAAFMVQLDPTIEELTDVRTAISEAVTNAIIHGYSQKGGTVRMDCSIDGDVFTATITDKGRGIADIEQAVDVKSTPGEGTKVTMTKRIGLVRADG